MRRSISRTSFKYCSTRLRSLAGIFLFSELTSPITESSRLSDCSRRARRRASVLPSPNNRSKTTCGLFCIGNGEVAFCHEIVSR